MLQHCRGRKTPYSLPFNSLFEMHTALVGRVGMVMCPHRLSILYLRCDTERDVAHHKGVIESFNSLFEMPLRRAGGKESGQR